VTIKLLFLDRKAFNRNVIKCGYSRRKEKLTSLFGEELMMMVLTNIRLAMMKGMSSLLKNSWTGIFDSNLEKAKNAVGAG